MYIIWVLLILLYLIINTILTIAMMSTETTNSTALRVIMVICCELAGLPIMIVSLTVGFAAGIIEVIKSGLKHEYEGR